MAALGLGGADRLAHLVDPILPPLLFRHRLQPKPRLVDVRVGVEDLRRHPGFQMLLPKGPINVGVLPHVVQRNGIHGSTVLAFSAAKGCRYRSQQRLVAGPDRDRGRNVLPSGGPSPARSARLESLFDQGPGDRGGPQGTHVERIDARHGALGHVGDDLRRLATCRRAAAHRQPRDGQAGLGQQHQVPRQFAGQPLDHRPQQVARPMRQRDARDASCPTGKSPSASAAGESSGQKHNPSLPGGASANQPVDHVGRRLAAAEQVQHPLDRRAAVSHRQASGHRVPARDGDKRRPRW